MSAKILHGWSSDVSDALFERYRSLAARFGNGRVLALVGAGTRKEWIDRLDRDGRPRADDRLMTPAAWMLRDLDLWWPLAEAGLRVGHPGRENAAGG